MALCPFATWDPAGATPGGTIVPRVIILHVTAVEGMARPHDGLEWHFHVSKDGRIKQLVDTTLRADANLKANAFAVSIETEGLGDGTWTVEQIDSIVRLVNWLLDTHPTIARQRCDKWDGSGIGYHVMWGAPSPWTPVAKTCPGPNRIRQFDDVVLPAVLTVSAAVTPPPPPPPITSETDVQNIITYVDDSDRSWIYNTATGKAFAASTASRANFEAAGAKRVLVIDSALANALAAG